MLFSGSAIAGTVIVALGGLYYAFSGPSPEQLCERYADHYASTMARCGSEDPKGDRDAFILYEAHGKCFTVGNIRNSRDLQVCFKWLAEISCTEFIYTLESKKFPAQCINQLNAVE